MSEPLTVALLIHIHTISFAERGEFTDRPQAGARWISLEMRLVGDIGIIGLPNR